MNATEGAKKSFVEELKSLTPKQILAILAALAFAIALTLLGFGASCMCFGMLIIAVVLYMIPHMMGVTNIKIKVVIGIIFVIVTILVGVLSSSAIVQGQNDEPNDNNYFKDITYTCSGDQLAITTTVVGLETNDVRFYYGETVNITFGGQGRGSFDKDKFITLIITGTTASGTVTLDSSKLFVGYLVFTKVDDSGEKVQNNDTLTNWTYIKGTFDGDILPLILAGCGWDAAYIAIIYFMILVFSYVMRGRMETTREKMESEGRLYPQGYGRCDRCNSVVLPNEVQCRKCGAYIDRPKDMRPNKKDFFECSECGAEVPNNATVCPKCGVPFDEDEIEVVHADGTVEVTKETFECSECGAEVPVTATFCPKCGAKFED